MADTITQPTPQPDGGDTKTSPPKKSKARRVFGRRRVTHEGTDWIIEMRRDGLALRTKWARSWHVVGLTTVVDLMVVGQKQLPL